MTSPDEKARFTEAAMRLVAACERLPLAYITCLAERSTWRAEVTEAHPDRQVAEGMPGGRFAFPPRTKGGAS